MTDLNAHITDLRIELRRAYAAFMDERTITPAYPLKKEIETSQGTLTICASVSKNQSDRSGTSVRTDLRLNGQRINRAKAEALLSS